MSANSSRKGSFVMRKLIIACLSVSPLLAGIAHAAPGTPVCTHDRLPNVNLGDRWEWVDGKKTKTEQIPSLPGTKEDAPDDIVIKNCFYDDIFVLSGDEMVPNPVPMGMPAMVPLVKCPKSGDCYLVDSDAKVFLTSA